MDGFLKQHLNFDTCAVKTDKEYCRLFRLTTRTIELRHEKTNILVSDPVRHKPGCTATEDG